MGQAFRVGDRVVRNPATWVANDFDAWGRGQGVGVVVEPPFAVEDLGEVDVRWPGGRCFEAESGLLLAPPGQDAAQMLPLDDNLWSRLSPQRFAPRYPGLLRELAETIAARTYSRDSLGQLWTMCDDWSTFDATLAAVPHLVDICRQQPPPSTARIDLLAWVGWCVACIHLNRQDGPEQLKQWYHDCVPVARDLIAESLPFTSDADDQWPGVRRLLAAFAACHGNPALAFILYELEAGGFQCDHCRSFILPMESSMNPFWVERNQGN